MMRSGHLNYYPLNRCDGAKGGGEESASGSTSTFVGGDDARGRGRHHALLLEWLGFAMLVSRWSSTSIFTVFATPPARIKATEGLLSWTLALDSCPTKVPHENQTFSR
jgi:hypothetical protein